MFSSAIKISRYAFQNEVLRKAFGSITAPQLVQIVNDLDRRVYRTYRPIHNDEESVTSSTPKIPPIHPSKGNFGELAEKSKDVNDGFHSASHFTSELTKTQAETEEKFEISNDHHLRLSRTGRNHEPSWYLGKIYRFCQDGNTQAALKMFFHQMLVVDRVMPDANMIHVLLDGLAHVGDSESAFRVYRKMTELGIHANHSTYSRLFKACTEDISAWQREHRYDLHIPATTAQLPASPGQPQDIPVNLTSFAGPGLERAKGLWKRLHDRGFRMNRFTYNTLMQALAKAGDLPSCFKALDEMLGVGGLPYVPLPSREPSSKSKDTALPPFRPDGYTLTAILVAIASSFRAGGVTLLESIQLGLQMWHIILPRLTHGADQHHFTLLAGILGQTEYTGGVHRRYKFRLRNVERSFLPVANPTVIDALEIIPNELPRLPLRQQFQHQNSMQKTRILASQQAAQQLLQQASSMALLEESNTSQQPLALPIDSPLQSATLVQKTELMLHSLSRPSLVEIDLQDVDLAGKSPINLLLPLSSSGVRVPLKGNSLSAPWQRLALVGGLDGFLDCMQQTFNVTVTAPQLFTKLVTLLPPPSVTDNDHLDRWELLLLGALKKYKVVLDLPLLNSLLLRRSSAGVRKHPLMTLAAQHGISPDEFTWGCLASDCRSVAQVRDFLGAYAKAAAAASVAEKGVKTRTSRASVRPSIYVYSMLLANTQFHWDVNAFILRSMMGRKASKRAKDAANDLAYANSIPPNRRMLAEMEMNVAFYRDMLARDIIPKDDSSVAPCEETGYKVIPSYSRRAFNRFIPVYKAWAEQPIATDQV